MSSLKAKGRKIFECPICTICLDPMMKDLAVFTVCGHVFHYNCAVNCHQNSRKCPNCRMRSTEIQSLHYVVEEISGVDEQMQSLLSNLNDDQKTHMSKLLSDHETLLHQNQQLTQRNKYLEEKNQQIEIEVAHIHKEKLSLQEFNKSIDEKRRDLQIRLKELEQLYQLMEKENSDITSQNEQMKQKIMDFGYLEQIGGALKTSYPDEYLRSLKLKPINEQIQCLNDYIILRMSQYRMIEKENQELNEVRAELQRKNDKLTIGLHEIQKENNTIRDMIKYRDNKILKFPDSSQEDNEKTKVEFKKKPTQQTLLKFGSSTMRKTPLNQSLIVKK